MSQSFMYKLADSLLSGNRRRPDWVLYFTFSANCSASDRYFYMYICPETAFLTTEIEEKGLEFMCGWENLDTDSIDFWFELKGIR